MRRGEVYVGIARIIHAATFSIRIVGSSESLKVSIGPSIDSQSKHGSSNSKEDYQTAAIRAAAFFN